MNQNLRNEIETKLYDLETEFSSSVIKNKLRDFAEFIEGALGSAESQFIFNVINDDRKTWLEKRDLILARLNGKLFSPEWTAVKQQKTSVSELPIQVEQYQNNKVFIVHGHDDAARESVARFLEKLGLIPIILHEQANSSLTVIEKLERNSDVGFAVVLLTPDDVGNKKEFQSDLVSRARQNVLIELGYFVGKLGRGKVCPLRVGDTEIPSDFSGVVYTDMDKAGAWRTKLAQELVVAKFTINLEALVS
jgi:predicted nucleotide-binding protein